MDYHLISKKAADIYSCTLHVIPILLDVSLGIARTQLNIYFNRTGKLSKQSTKI